MPRSRRTQTLEKNTIRTIILAFVGIIIAAVLLIIFGTQLLINFSLGLEKLRGGGTNNLSSDNATPAYIAPPILDPMYDATNSAHVTITGIADDKNQTINLYVNGKLENKTKSKDDKHFVFKDVTLDQGDNDIKTKAVGPNNSQSDYSNDIRITFSNQAPKLDIAMPQDGQTFGSSPITVSGSTDPNDSVTVNDFVAIVDDSGKFSYMLTIQKGDNSVTISAIDQAGNKTTKQLTIHLQ